MCNRLPGSFSNLVYEMNFSFLLRLISYLLHIDNLHCKGMIKQIIVSNFFFIFIFINNFHFLTQKEKELKKISKILVHIITITFIYLFLTENVSKIWFLKNVLRLHQITRNFTFFKNVYTVLARFIKFKTLKEKC